MVYILTIYQLSKTSMKTFIVKNESGITHVTGKITQEEAVAVAKVRGIVGEVEVQDITNK